MLGYVAVSWDDAGVAPDGSFALDLRQTADRIAAELAKDPAIEGVLLYGSVARGDTTESSDIDLLVIGAEGERTTRDLRRAVASLDPDRRASFVFHTGETFDGIVRDGSRFLVHLRLEGEALVDRDGRLGRFMSGPWTPVSVREEIETELSRLANYRRPEIFGGRFLFPLAHVFTIGKAIVMARLADEGHFEFNRRKAFREFALRHPMAESDINQIASLEPFRARTRRESLVLPYEPTGDRAAEGLRRAVSAVYRVASAP